MCGKPEKAEKVRADRRRDDYLSATLRKKWYGCKKDKNGYQWNIARECNVVRNEFRKILYANYDDTLYTPRSNSKKDLFLWGDGKPRYI